MNLDAFLIQALNGLSFGALLFLLASGFTLVFGLMRIVNLAHGALYLAGGYVGIVTAVATGNFLFALLAGALAAALLGLVSERVLLRRVRGLELPEVLLTVGIGLVIADVALAIFGGNPQSLTPPRWLSGALDLGFIAYPRYRWFVIGLAVLVGVGLYFVQNKTRVGAIMRAGVDDREMTGMMGINVDRVFAWLFVFGAALAGLAGVAAAGQLTMRPGADTEILLFALVVVIVGGLGSVTGAAVGSALIGLIDSFAKVWIPELSYFAVFAPMAVVLVFRPRGLFGLPQISEAPPPLRADTNGRLSGRTTAVLIALGLGAIYAAPYVLPPFLVSLLTLVFISGLLATSVNLLAGEAGLVSIGHAGIAAAAGYGIAWATVNGMGVGASLAIALVLVLAVSAVFGLTTMKTKGIVYLMITLEGDDIVSAAREESESATLEGSMTDESRSETTEESKPKWIREAQEALDRTADAVRTAWDATRETRASALEAAKQAVKELGEALEKGLEVAKERWESETAETKPAEETTTETATAGATETGADTASTTPPPATPTQPPPTTPGDTEGESGQN